MKEGRGPFTPRFWPQAERSRKAAVPLKPKCEVHPSLLAQIERRRTAAVLSTLGLGHKPRGEGRPRSFHPSVLAAVPRSFHPAFLAANRAVKEGRGPFQTEHHFFCHKPKGEGRPWSLSNREVRGEGRPRSFHPSVLATNREVKEGRGPFTSLFCHKPRGEGRPRSFHISFLATSRKVMGAADLSPFFLATNRKVKDGRGPRKAAVLFKGARAT